MWNLQEYRTALVDLLQQRKKKINAIPWKRRKSFSSTRDDHLIGLAVLFEQWGFMDYIAARGLLVKALEASLEPPLPRKLAPGSVMTRNSRSADNLLILNTFP